jgi:hypothetical protein
MNVTITEIPFKVEEKTISLNEFLKRYISFVQDDKNIETVKHDIEKDDGKRYSLKDVRKNYAHSGV